MLRAALPNPNKLAVSRKALPLRGQVLFLDGGYYHIIGINHLGKMDPAYFRKQLVGVQLRESVVRVDPINEFGKCNTDRVIHWAIDTRGPDLFVVFQQR